VWENIKNDFMNRNKLEELVKACQYYNNIDNIYWLVPESGGYIKLVDEQWLSCNTGKHNGYEVHVYVESKIEEPRNVDEVVLDATDVVVEENNIDEDVGVQENEVVEDSENDSEYFPSSSSGDDPSFSNEYDDNVGKLFLSF
jgi:hypothetical protein